MVRKHSKDLNYHEYEYEFLVALQRRFGEGSLTSLICTMEDWHPFLGDASIALSNEQVIGLQSGPCNSVPKKCVTVIVQNSSVNASEKWAMWINESPKRTVVLICDQLPIMCEEEDWHLHFRHPVQWNENLSKFYRGALAPSGTISTMVNDKGRVFGPFDKKTFAVVMSGSDAHHFEISSGLQLWNWCKAPCDDFVSSSKFLVIDYADVDDRVVEFDMFLNKMALPQERLVSVGKTKNMGRYTSIVGVSEKYLEDSNTSLLGLMTEFRKNLPFALVGVKTAYGDKSSTRVRANHIESTTKICDTVAEEHFSALPLGPNAAWFTNAGTAKELETICLSLNGGDKALKFRVDNEEGSQNNTRRADPNAFQVTGVPLHLMAEDLERFATKVVKCVVGSARILSINRAHSNKGTGDLAQTRIIISIDDISKARDAAMSKPKNFKVDGSIARLAFSIAPASSQSATVQVEFALVEAYRGADDFYWYELKENMWFWSYVIEPDEISIDVSISFETIRDWMFKVDRNLVISRNYKTSVLVADVKDFKYKFSRYDEATSVHWNEAPDIVVILRDIMEEALRVTFNAAFITYYSCGAATNPPHVDGENETAHDLESTVCNIPLGGSRDVRFTDYKLRFPSHALEAYGWTVKDFIRHGTDKAPPGADMDERITLSFRTFSDMPAPAPNAQSFESFDAPTEFMDTSEVVVDMPDIPESEFYGDEMSPDPEPAVEPSRNFGVSALQSVARVLNFSPSKENVPKRPLHSENSLPGFTPGRPPAKMRSKGDGKGVSSSMSGSG